MDALHRLIDLDSLSARRIEVAIAAITLLAIGGFLALALGSDATGFANDVTMGVLWITAGTTIALPTIVVLHLGYDATAWLRGTRHGASEDGATAFFDAVLRIGELLFSLVVLAILGFAAYLFTTVPPGRGAGGVVMWIVFASGGSVILLSVTVLIRRVITGQ